MRRLTAVVVGLGVLGASAEPAAAATPATTLQAGVAASGGTPASPANATVTTSIRIDPPAASLPPGGSAGDRLPATQEITLRFGPGLVPALGAFSRCQGDSLRATGPDACPEGSQLGTAALTFEAYVGGSRLNGITDDARLFRGDGPAGVLLYIHASEPADTTLVMDGKLQDDSGGFATKLVVDTTPAAKVQGFDVALRTVAFTLDAKGTGAVEGAPANDAPPKLPNCRRLAGRRRRACARRSRNLEFCRRQKTKARVKAAQPRAGADGVTVLRSTGCPGGGYAVQARLAFGDGSQGVADAKAACS